MINEQTQGKILMAASLLIIVSIIAYGILNTPDKRNSLEKISDMVNEMPQGMDKAVRQLESRTPAEKLDDAIGDVGDDLKKSTNQN